MTHSVWFHIKDFTSVDGHLWTRGADLVGELEVAVDSCVSWPVGSVPLGASGVRVWHLADGRPGAGETACPPPGLARCPAAGMEGGVSNC